MNKMIQHWFDGTGEGDERIRAGQERAGSACFRVVMFLLWLAMVIGLVVERLDLVLVPFAVFMTGCVLYLLFLVRTGSFESEKPRAINRKRTALGYAVGGMVYAVTQFFFRLRGAEELTHATILDSALYACASSVIWIAIFNALVLLLRNRSDRRNEKKM